MRGETGGAAIHVLGCALMLLLLVSGLGLAESARAAMFKAQGLRALAAAADSAARAAPAGQPGEQRTAAATFQRVLAANLGGLPGNGSVTLLPRGGRDPVSGGEIDRPMLVARLELTYQPAYIGRWLKPVPVQLSYTALLPVQRKTTP
jgi:hypothetical protein